MATDTVELILVLGIGGGIAAYVTNFMKFKDWVDEQFKGGGNGNGTCSIAQACQGLPNLTAADKLTAAKLIVVAIGAAFKSGTQMTQTQAGCIAGKITTSDVNAVFSKIQAACSGGCTVAQINAYALAAYNVAKKYASSCGVTLKAFTPFTPTEASLGSLTTLTINATG